MPDQLQNGVFGEQRVRIEGDDELPGDLRHPAVQRSRLTTVLLPQQANARIVAECALHFA